jgi:hypothetical protein
VVSEGEFILFIDLCQKSAFDAAVSTLLLLYRVLFINTVACQDQNTSQTRHTPAQNSWFSGLNVDSYSQLPAQLLISRRFIHFALQQGLANFELLEPSMSASSCRQGALGNKHMGWLECSESADGRPPPRFSVSCTRWPQGNSLRGVLPDLLVHHATTPTSVPLTILTAIVAGTPVFRHAP